jgi:sec-independent protein translocase protein TatB
MFDIAWGELILIGIVALIVIGPKELPAVLRAVGQWTTKIRRMASEFQGQFQEALREAEMADLKKEVDNLNETARGVSSSLVSQFDPLDTKDATKWDPTRGENKAENKTSEATAGDDETKAWEENFRPEPAAVTADGYVPPPSEPASATAPAVPPGESELENTGATHTPPVAAEAAAPAPHGSGRE